MDRFRGTRIRGPPFLAPSAQARGAASAIVVSGERADRPDHAPRAEADKIPNHRAQVGYYYVVRADCRPRSSHTLMGMDTPNAEVRMPPVLTVDDVAALLNTSRRAVYRLVEGGLPHFRIDSRQLRFREHDIEAWINGRVTAATCAAPPIPIPILPVAPGGVAPADWSKPRRASPPSPAARPCPPPKKNLRAAPR